VLSSAGLALTTFMAPPGWVNPIYAWPWSSVSSRRGSDSSISSIAVFSATAPEMSFERRYYSHFTMTRLCATRPRERRTWTIPSNSWWSKPVSRVTSSLISAMRRTCMEQETWTVMTSSIPRGIFCRLVIVKGTTSVVVRISPRIVIVR